MGGFPEESEDAKYILLSAEKSFGAVGMRSDAVFCGNFISKEEAIKIINEKSMGMGDIEDEWMKKGVVCIWFQNHAEATGPFNKRATNLLSSAWAVRGDAIIFARA